MARNTDVPCPSGQWTELSNGEAIAAGVTFYCKGEVNIAATTGGTAPADFTSSIKYDKGQGERNVTLAELFPGIVGARLWAYPATGRQISVFVSYA